MTPAVTSQPAKRRGPGQQGSLEASMSAGSGQTMAQGMIASPSPSRPDGGDPGVTRSSAPSGHTALQPTVRDRLLQVLDGWIAAECRAIVERRLAGVQAAARAALLPSRIARAELADRAFGSLQPAAIVRSLSPSVETEQLLLLDLAAGIDPMLREMSLDALSGVARDTSITPNRIGEFCATLLAPGLALLGAGSEPVTAGGAQSARPPIAAASGEAAFLGALRQDDAEDAQRILAAHAGVEPDKVAQAVWTRDARALLGLAWKAGYSMRAARLLQIQIAGIPPPMAIGPTETGGVPLGRGELAWQLALLDAS